MTMYNEDEKLFTRSMHGIIKNLAHLCKRDRIKTWGKEGWKKVVVCIVSDGCANVNSRTLSVIAAMGCYQEGVTKTNLKIGERAVTAHIYEYTTQISVTPALKIETSEKVSSPSRLSKRKIKGKSTLTAGSSTLSDPSSNPMSVSSLMLVPFQDQRRFTIFGKAFESTTTLAVPAARSLPSRASMESTSSICSLPLRTLNTRCPISSTNLLRAFKGVLLSSQVVSPPVATSPSRMRSRVILVSFTRREEAW
jgi:hypothetical protein